MHRRNGRRVACKSTDARRRPCFRVEFAYPKGSERDERAVAKPNFEVRMNISVQLCFTWYNNDIAESKDIDFDTYRLSVACSSKINDDPAKIDMYQNGCRWRRLAAAAINVKYRGSLRTLIKLHILLTVYAGGT